MELVLTKKDDLRKVLREEIDQALKRGLLGREDPTGKEWLSNSELISYLNLSKATLQRLRRSGQLPFSKLNGLIFYKRSDVIDLLERNRRSR